MAKSAPQKISLRHEARQLALQTLYAWAMSGVSITQIKNDFFAEDCFAGELSKTFDQEYYDELLQGIVPNVADLDEMIAPYLDRVLSQVNPVELAILRLAAYEFKTRLEIPYKVILNEAIVLAKSFGASDSHKFINGVLDKLVKKMRPSEVKMPMATTA